MLAKPDFCLSVEKLELIRASLEDSLETNSETQELFFERAEKLLEKGKQSTPKYFELRQSMEELETESDSLEDLLEKFSREGLVCSTEE